MRYEKLVNKQMWGGNQKELVIRKSAAYCTYKSMIVLFLKSDIKFKKSV